MQDSSRSSVDARQFTEADCSNMKFKGFQGEQAEKGVTEALQGQPIKHSSD